MAQVVSCSVEETSAEEIHAILERDGCVVLTGIVSTGHHHELKEEVDRLFTHVPVCQGNFFGYATKRMSSILARSVTSASLFTDPKILGVMDAFLLRNCHQYQINLRA